jgi:acetyl-CoA carboxylase biotin carboxyl carrier protein
MFDESMKIMSKSFDADSIRKLAQVLVDTGLSEIEYETNGERIYVARKITQNIVQNVAAPVEPVASAPHVVPASVSSENAVKSPMVGTAYLSPEPGANAFIKIGDHVKVGQTLLIVEAMKVMNQIKSTRAGCVKSILVQDAQPVEFDQPLVVID